MLLFLLIINEYYCRFFILDVLLVLSEHLQRVTPTTVCYVILQFCTVTVRNSNGGNLVFNINVSKYNTEAGGDVPEVTIYQKRKADLAVPEPNISNSSVR